MTGAAPRFLLSADDYALSPAVSAGIEDLARAGRLSSTTALVTTRTWDRSGADAARLRNYAALGLHLNLTLGGPLGPMPRHAPGGRFPAISDWIRRSLTGRVDGAEVEAEITRQFDRFEAVAGAQPDLVDGHHHVHALPVIRHALARVVARRYGGATIPLMRVPGDSPLRILRRRAAVPKALLIAGLSAGSSATFHATGAPVNQGFAGFSAFDRAIPFAQELAGFTTAPGPFHMVMCHPGHTDDELAALDPVFERREDEFAALMAAPDLPDRLFHPARHRAADGLIDWGQLDRS